MRNFWVGLLLCLPLAAWADDVVESGHAKMMLVSNRVTVAEDLSYETNVEVKYKVLTEQGARQDGKFPISYNRALTSVEILQAETAKADGRRIPVPESAIARQSGSVGLYTMKDLETISLAWPDFAAGDSVHLRYRTRNKPLFPGYFSIASQAGENLVQDKIELILELPEKLVLHQDMQGFVQNRNEVKDGRRIMAWSYSSKSTKKLENRLTDYRQAQPHVWVTSFPNWGSVAKAFMDRHTPQAAITPEIEKLAKELTADAATEKEKAQRIYDWVRKNIRYIAIYAGIEGWVPHKASDVLANRFGDCKDHTVLMEAMLRAVGIESVPALIQSDYLTFQLTRVPMPSFNHVINYLPGLDVYLDATAVHTEFGRLPDSDQGKPVVRGKLAETVGTTPITTMAGKRVKRLTRINITDWGNAIAETTIDVSSGFSTWFDEFRASIGKGKENVWAKGQMEKKNRRGFASLIFLDEKDGMKSFKVSQTINDYLPDSEIGLHGFEPIEIGPVSIGWVTDLFETDMRSGGFSCYSAEVEDIVEITLPNKLKLLRLPRDREVSSDAVTLKISYSSLGNTHTMKRLFRWNPPNPGSCSVQEWYNWLNPVREVRSAVRSASLAYERN